MPEKIIRPLKDASNEAILNAIRNDSSSDYQNRIPDATKAGVQETAKQLMNYRPRWNEFVDALVNRIGQTIIRNEIWTNPLAEFKQGILTYGDTIEEIQVGLLKAHNYDPTREYLERDIFGTELPHVENNFHTVNRQDFYKISVNEPLLQRAFLESDGLSKFVTKLMQAPATSDYWDEFLLMTSLFQQYEANGGFHHVHVADVGSLNSNEADAKMALRKMRAMADNMKFINTKYNAARMPTHAKAEDLVLFVTPEYNAAIDVEALAGAFNITKADMIGRVIPIPETNFNIEGAQAIMTTRDFFVVADQRIENTSQFNPVSLNNNYFLHHWEVVSASRFVPAVLFHTGADDEVIEVSTPVTSVTALTVVDDEDNTVTEVERGGLYAAIGSAVTDPEGGVNDAVRWTISGHTSAKTRITQTGSFFVGGDEGATTLTITATSTWLNPENLREDGQTATTTVTVAGETVPQWPTQGRIVGILIDGEPVADFDAATLSYASPVEAPIDGDTVEVQSVGGGDTDVDVSADGTVLTVAFDGGTGAPVVYTITAT